MLNEPRFSNTQIFYAWGCRFKCDDQKVNTFKDLLELIYNL